MKNYNDLNKIFFYDLTQDEFDLLLGLLYVFRSSNKRKATLNLSDLQLLSDHNNKLSFEKFKKDIIATYDKLLNLKFISINNVETIKFALFNKYKIDEKKGTISIFLNSEISKIINDCSANFNNEDIEKLANLKSKYSKNLYSLLYEFKFTGYAKFSIDFFRKAMDIPDSYEIRDIDKNVLSIAIKEVTPIFKNITVKKIKNKRVIALEFKFQYHEYLEDFIFDIYSDDIMISNADYYGKQKLNKFKNKC